MDPSRFRMGSVLPQSLGAYVDHRCQRASPIRYRPYGVDDEPASMLEGEAEGEGGVTREGR
jgi:hypothetical protein